MASVKLRVLGGQGRNNKDELWRNMLVQVETWAQAVPDAAAGEAAKAGGAGQGQEGRARPSPQKQQLPKPPGGFLLLKSP